MVKWSNKKIQTIEYVDLMNLLQLLILALTNIVGFIELWSQCDSFKGLVRQILFIIYFLNRKNTEKLPFDLKKSDRVVKYVMVTTFMIMDHLCKFGS